MKLGLPPWLKRAKEPEPTRALVKYVAPPPADLTDAELKNGWTPETLAAYLAERARAQAGVIMFDPEYRRQPRPRWANNSYSPLRWRG